MLNRTTLFSACFILSSLAGCGHSNFDRGMSGASIGAATGAAVGAVTGLTVAQGAVLGAAGGAITGLATSPSQVNLGKPVWRNNQSTQAAGNSTVQEIQRGLAQKGYAPGPADGVAGKRTRAAIRAYQQNHGLLVDGRATAQLAQHIQTH